MKLRYTAAAAAAFALLWTVVVCGPVRAEDNVHNGLYAGVGAGYQSSTISAPGFKLGDDGALGSVFGGFGWVVNGVYLGIEIDGTLRDLNPTIGDETFNLSTSSQWMASGKVRVGVPVGPALLFLAAGPAVQRTRTKLMTVEDLDSEDGPTTMSSSDSQLTWGLAAGGGIDVVLGKTLTVGLDVTHYHWPDEKFSLGDEIGKLGQGETVGRVRLSFKLN